MSVCLINLKFEKDNVINFRRQEHTGIGYIASALEKSGETASIINAQFENLPNCEIINRVKNINPEIVGISLYEELLDEAIKVMKEIKKYNPSIKIIIGGHYGTFNAKRILEIIKEVDFVNLGEGEISFPNLVNAIKKNISLINIKGVYFRDGNKLYNTGISDIIEDLDGLEYPKREFIDRSKIITNISASRGCYGLCSFCSTKAFYSLDKDYRIRIRNPINVIDEIEYLVETQNAYRFFFTDDNFMVSEKLQPGWINIFVNEIRERKLKIAFNFDCRVDDIDKKLFFSLKQAGLIGIFLGVESNSEDTLKLYCKNTTREKNLEAITLLRELRIDCWMGNIMFHPLTKLEDIKDDIDFFENIKYTLYFNYSNPVSHLAGKLKIYKGTSLYNNLKISNLIKEDSLTCEYEFADNKVKLFYEFVQKYKNILNDIICLDSIHLLEIASKVNNKSLANKIHALSRKYMRLDFNIFKEAHKRIVKEECNNIEVLLNDLVEPQKFNRIYSELNKISVQLNSEVYA